MKSIVIGNWRSGYHSAEVAFIGNSKITLIGIVKGNGELIKKAIESFNRGFETVVAINGNELPILLTDLYNRPSRDIFDGLLKN